MSNQAPPYHYSCWSSAGDWRQGHVILAANVDTIPSPPPRQQAAIMVDGLWGEHEWMLYPQPYRLESPYLAWLRLLSKNANADILTGPIHKAMWQAHPTKSSLVRCHSPLMPGHYRLATCTCPSPDISFMVR